MSVRLFSRIRTVRTVPPPPGVLKLNTVIAGDPDAPVRRRVQIVEAVPNAHGHIFPATSGEARWHWAGPDGKLNVTGLDPDKRYHAIAYDHTGVHDPVIKLNLTPEVPA